MDQNYVACETSVGYAAKVFKTSCKSNFMELYERGSLFRASKLLLSLNLKGLCALDLEMKKMSGQPPSVEATQAGLAYCIVSPPCTWFSLLSQHPDHPKMDA